jgi:serine/threonine protein kinase
MAKQELLKTCEDFRHCFVMPRGDRSLAAVLSDEAIATNMQLITPIVRQLAEALQFVHSRGIVHGDCKPLNFLRVGELWKLIDFDAAVRVGEPMGGKCSTAFIPPERISVTAEGKAVVKGATARDEEKENEDEGEVEEDAFAARFSVDSWGLGVVVYRMCTGFRLFNEDHNNNVDQKTLMLLAGWDSILKAEKLAEVQDPLAKNLLARLLQRDPLRRPQNMGQVLAHPFLSGKRAARLQGQAAKFDVFLSYRVDADADLAQELYEILVGMGLKVLYCLCRAWQTSSGWLLTFYVLSFGELVLSSGSFTTQNIAFPSQN